MLLPRDLTLPGPCTGSAYSVHGLRNPSLPLPPDLPPVPCTPRADSARRRLQADVCADLDASGMVDVTDLLAMLGAFGTNADGDTNGDGATDVTDLLSLLAAFGSASCTPGGAVQATDVCSSTGLVGTTAQSASGRAINVIPGIPAVGDAPYTDRGYDFTTLSSFETMDAYYIQPANDDKNTPPNSVMWTLNVPVPVTIYIDFWGGDAHLATGSADWLLATNSQWVQQTDMTGSEFTAGCCQHGLGPVFSQTFPAGPISLMGNGGGGHGAYYLFIEANCASAGDGTCPCGGAPSASPGVIYDGCVRKRSTIARGLERSVPLRERVSGVARSFHRLTNRL